MAATRIPVFPSRYPTNLQGLTRQTGLTALGPVDPVSVVPRVAQVCKCSCSRSVLVITRCRLTVGCIAETKKVPEWNRETPPLEVGRISLGTCKACVGESSGNGLGCIHRFCRPPWPRRLGKSRCDLPSSPTDLFFCTFSTMSTPSAIPRTAPIAIAPKPPRFPPSRQGSIHHLDSYSGFRNGIDSPDSESLNGRPQTPCEACHRRRLDCVMSDEEEGCVACNVNGMECSLIESPPPRKRKLDGDAEDSHSKRR